MKQQKSNGFTLIELSLVLFIMALVATAAIPSFSSFMERQKVAAQAAAISSTLSIARAEALTRLEEVMVCWNQTNAAITQRSFTLRPGQMAVMTTDDPAEVIRDIPFSDDGLFIDDTEVDDCVSFLPSGRLDTNTTVIDPLAFGICKEADETAGSKAVIMNATGRASTVDNDTGGTINCS